MMAVLTKGGAKMEDSKQPYDETQQITNLIAGGVDGQM